MMSTKNELPGFLGSKLVNTHLLPTIHYTFNVSANEMKPKKIKEDSQKIEEDKESLDEPPRSETEPSDSDRVGDMVTEVGLQDEVHYDSSVDKDFFFTSRLKRLLLANAVKCFRDPRTLPIF